jgi:uncharacterized protein (DUF608 family)
MSGCLFEVSPCQPLQWQSFRAKGFSRSVCGVVYSAGQAACGAPLGGIGTGCLDLNTDGRLGRCSAFNSFVPPRELDEPFLAVRCEGGIYVLGAAHDDSVRGFDEVAYWGHYPVVDIEGMAGSSLSVGVRSWSTFLPGDAHGSNVPGARIEVYLRNVSKQTIRGEVALAFSGPAIGEANIASFQWKALSGKWQGVMGGDAQGVGYALGAGSDGKVRAVRGSHGHASHWAAVFEQRQEPVEGDGRAAVVVAYELSPGEVMHVPFVLAWYAPTWRGEEAHQYVHAYAGRFADAAAVARYLAVRGDELLGQILAWQEVIYAEDKLPMWLRDQLVNVLHTVTEDSFWAGRCIPPEDWHGSMGLFGMTESPRTTPHVAIPSDWYGSLPIIFFFPVLMRSLLRAYAHFQLANGEVALGIGSGTDLQTPIYHCLHTTNGLNFVDLVHRLWLRTNDEGILREFYPAVKRAIAFAQSLDRDADGLVDLDPEPGGNQFYGEWKWLGTATHVAGFWLAALRMAERMASAMEDRAFAHDCRVWLQLGQRSLEEKLWDEDSYLLYHDTETGEQSKTVLANQLAGQWLADLQGLGEVFPQARVRRVLGTVERLNVKGTPFGALNAVRKDGSIDFGGKGHSAEIFPCENLCLAMTMMFHGERAKGVELAQRVVENIVLNQRVQFDLPNRYDRQTGRITHGTDFYQNMIIWAMPAALEQMDLAAASGCGSLVARVLAAAQRVEAHERPGSGTLVMRGA